MYTFNDYDFSMIESLLLLVNLSHLSDRKSPQISKTLLRILIILAVLWSCEPF